MTLRDFFVPLFGRTGQIVPGDVIIALFTGLCLASLTLLSFSIMHLTQPTALLRFCKVLGVIMIVSFAIVITRFPYSDIHPKRVWLQHVTKFRESQDDSYIWFSSMDFTNLKHLKALPSSLGQTLRQAKDLPSLDYQEIPWYFPIKSFFCSGCKYSKSSHQAFFISEYSVFTSLYIGHGQRDS